MNTFQIVVTAVLGTLVAVLVAGIAAVSFGPRLALAHAAGEVLSGDPTERCRRLEQHESAEAGQHLTAMLDLSADQQAALAPVLDVLDRWHQRLVDTCHAMDLSTAAAGLESLERLLGDGAAAVGELRPAFAAFHASLDAAQRERVDSWLTHHHDDGGGFRHRWHD